eukprot:2639160-Lingulodinium_polyedra.AAC.1
MGRGRSLWIEHRPFANTGLLHQVCYTWVVAHVTFKPLGLLPPAETSTQTWTSLGLPADLIEVYASQWHLVWSDGELQVHDFFQDDTEVYGQICDSILSILSIGGFSESRWLSIGRSC